MGPSQPSPVQVTALGPSVTQVSAGPDHACARKSDASIWCWGVNSLGELGDGTLGGQDCGYGFVCQPSPAQVTGLDTEVVEVSAGGVHSCALRSDGTVWCWGMNANGLLGDGTTTGQDCGVNVTSVCKPSPTPVVQTCP